MDKLGTSAMGIMEDAKVLEFSSKAFKAEKPEWIYGDISLSAIAHVIVNKSFQHYVVIFNMFSIELVILTLFQF